MKRLLGILLGLDASLSRDAFKSILYQRPSLRQLLLRHWASKDSFLKLHPVVVGFLGSGEAIDDLSYILIARAVVETQASSSLSRVEIDDILVHYNKQDPIQLYCRLWILSKYAPARDLKAEIDLTNLIWPRHPYLSRLVAGFSGIFMNSPYEKAFAASLRKWGGPAAAAVTEFFESIGLNKAGYRSIQAFISAPNPSVPNGITHAKTLMLRALLWNSDVPRLDRAKLLGKHGVMMKDWYYQGDFSAIITAAP